MSLRPISQAFALIALPLPAAAQSFEEAVRTNLMLAFELCLEGTGSTRATVNDFVAAGFEYARDDTFDNGAIFETYHRFTAPADTARAELYEGQTAPYCSAESEHIGALTVAPIIFDWVSQRQPGRFTYRPPGTVVYGAPRPCPGFVETNDTTGLPFEILIGALDGGGTCAEDRTVRITPGKFP